VREPPLTPEPAPRPQRFWHVDLGPLRRSRQFRLIFLGQAVSLTGSMLTSVAMPFQAYQLTHSSLVVGLVSFAELLPLLAVAFVGGALADTVDRRLMVMLSTVGLALCSAALVVNSVLGHPQLWVLFVAAAASAGLGALERPSLDAMIPRVVESADIAAATALDSLGTTLGQVAAPAVAGGLIALAGLGTVYSLDVVSFVVTLFALLLMEPVPPAPDAGRASLASIVEGLRYALSRQDLLGTYLVDMAAMVFGMPQALFPQLATRLGGPAVLGLLYAAPALGSLLVSATSGWMTRSSRRGRAIVLAAASWGLAIIAFGFAPDLWVALLALVVAGGFDMVSGIMRSTIWNTTIPDSLRGRLAGIELVSFSSGPVLGDLEAGVVDSIAGLQFSIISGGVACVVATLALSALLPGLWRSRANSREAPTRAGG
jgi:MFS family permease